MTTLDLWDVKCDCGFQSAAKRAQADAEKVRDAHRYNAKHDNTVTTNVRALRVQLDDFGRPIPPVQVL